MNKPYLLAGSLTLAIAIWVALGAFSNDNDTSATAQQSHSPLMNVEVQHYQASDIQRRLTAYGNVRPNRAVTVRAETAGRIEEIIAREGAKVGAGETLVSIEMNDRLARRAEAQSLVDEKSRTHAMTKKLGDQGYQAQKMVDESYSALQKARAELAQVELEIRNTRVTAPFAGILERRLVDVGDYAPINSELVTIVDNDPLKITVHIPQQDIAKVTRDTTAEVLFATGETRQGNVSFVASRADETTRTFRVEISVANPDGTIPSGTSAEAHLPAGMVTAQFVSPALFTLNDDGEIGIKSVNDENIVAFFPVDIIYSEANGAWVTGLPDTSNVITVGQGFVRKGDSVIASEVEREVFSNTLSTVQAQPADATLESIQ